MYSMKNNFVYAERETEIWLQLGGRGEMEISVTKWVTQAQSLLHEWHYFSLLLMNTCNTLSSYKNFSGLMPIQQCLHSFKFILFASHDTVSITSFNHWVESNIMRLNNNS